MFITFEKEYLKRMYETGKCDKKYPFQRDIVKRYIKRIDTLMEVKEIEDLYTLHSLNYKVLSGDKAGISSIRVNNQYRIEFTVNKAKDTVVTICNIIELSNHYK